MAQINVQYPSGLESLPGLGGLVMGERYDSARKSEGLNQQQALQDMFQNGQMHPLRMQQAQLANDTTSAQLPGVAATSNRLVRDNAVREGVPISMEQKAAISKLLAGISDDDFKRMENDIAQHMQHPDPKVSADAQRMFELLPAIYKENKATAARSEREAAIAALKHRNDMELADKNNAAGRYKSKKADSGVKSVQDMITTGKLDFEKASVLFQNMAIAAEMEGGDTPEEKAESIQKAAVYRSQAQAYAQKAAEMKQAASMTPKAGGVDLKTLGGNIQTVPERQPMPFPSATPQAAPVAPPVQKQPTLMDVQKMYPGVPPEKLKEAFKKKFGVDLQ